MSISNTLYSVLSFIAFFTICIPLPWHMKAWNVGLCSFSVWTAVSLLVCGVNSIIWAKDTVNRAPVWCDITSRLMLGSSYGILASSLCINRGLYKMTTLQSFTWSQAEKRQMIMIDLAISVGIPFVEIIFYYVVQHNRFNIFQELGCRPSLSDTPLSLVLLGVPSTVLSMFSGFYAVRCVIARRRMEEGLTMDPFTTPGFNASLWYRLLAVAASGVLVILPLSAYSAIRYMQLALIHPWLTWEETHATNSVIFEVPSTEWKANLNSTIGSELLRWTRVYCAFILFGLFGFAGEAAEPYKMAWVILMKFIGRSKNKERPPSLRFNAFTDTLSFRGSRTERDYELSISSVHGRVNDGGGPVDIVSDEGAIRDESVQKPPAIPHLVFVN